MVSKIQERIPTSDTKKPGNGIQKILQGKGIT
jgi:hypothetical protein